jgi:hypothetical protein
MTPDPRQALVEAAREEFLEKHRSRIAFEPNTGCELWIGARSGASGYGSYAVDGKVVRAHRLAWASRHGPIPEGMDILHKCDTPACVNPGHLFMGTAADNVRDMIRKGRRASCSGTINSQAKLTDEVVREIREKRARGVPQKRLAKEYGVHKKTIQDATKGRLWRHVT